MYSLTEIHVRKTSAVAGTQPSQPAVAGDRSFESTDSYAPPGLRAQYGFCFPGLAPWANVLRPSGPGIGITFNVS